jgi:transcriptional regulator with XRE-family HTH domain
LTRTGARGILLAMREQNLAKIVRERMEAKGLTMYALAKEAGITRQTVGNFLTTGRAITSDKLAAIFAVLDLIVVPKEAKEAK